ncbi:MAG: chemotaxis protein CheW [Gammaproteobacteria bacterium]
MEKVDQYLIFVLDGRRYALPLSAVDQVARRVEITALIKAPPIIAGVINVQGRVVPVFDIRLRFGLAERRALLTDRLIIAHTARWTVALVVDDVLDLAVCSEWNLVEADRILPQLAYVEGVVKHNDGLILIHDLERFLSLDEEMALQTALNAT